MKAKHINNSDKDIRTGLIVEKLGMTSIYDAAGNFIPVTLLQVHKNYVVSTRTIEKDGYTALQLATNPGKMKNINKPQHKDFADIPPQKVRAEFLVSRSGMVETGSIIDANHFVTGQFIDLQAVTIGKGFAGVMKRYGFRGMRASHGVSVSHRAHGSTGQRQDPGKVFKNKKMAGRMGNRTKTLQNIKIVGIKDSIIIVKGCVPGHEGAFLKIRDSIKKASKIKLPFPASCQV